MLFRSYRVWWRELGSGGWTHVTTGLDADGTSYAISGASPSTTYEVTVLAHNLQGDSENNPVISFSTPGAISNPSSPIADFDGDGSVEFSDFLLFAEGFGRSAGDEGWDARFDLDGNNDVCFSDFLIFAQQFGG